VKRKIPRSPRESDPITLSYLNCVGSMSKPLAVKEVNKFENKIRLFRIRVRLTLLSTGGFVPVPKHHDMMA
jgi:hypothetical protein